MGAGVLDQRQHAPAVALAADGEADVAGLGPRRQRLQGQLGRRQGAAEDDVAGKDRDLGARDGRQGARGALLERLSDDDHPDAPARGPAHRDRHQPQHLVEDARVGRGLAGHGIEPAHQPQERLGGEHLGRGVVRPAPHARLAALDVDGDKVHGGAPEEVVEHARHGGDVVGQGGSEQGGLGGEAAAGGGQPRAVAALGLGLHLDGEVEAAHDLPLDVLGDEEVADGRGAAEHEQHQADDEEGVALLDVHGFRRRHAPAAPGAAAAGSSPRRPRPRGCRRRRRPRGGASVRAPAR